MGRLVHLITLVERIAELCAVVTGATDGIGHEFALQLAAKGFNILLVSRTQAKLTAVQEEIGMHVNFCFPSSVNSVQPRRILGCRRGPSPSTTRPPLTPTTSRCAPLLLSLTFACSVISCPLTQCTSAHIFPVNNVGRSHDMPVSFAATPLDELSAIVNINVLGTLRTTRAVLPAMVARKQRALILTLSSFASTPTPLLATYSGSKAYLVAWNGALAAELKPARIDARIINTFYVVSAMSKVRRASLLIPTPRTFVRAALRLRGSTGTRSAFTPYWAHALVDFALEHLELRGLWSRLALKENTSVRARALKKQAREQKAQ